MSEKSMRQPAKDRAELEGRLREPLSQDDIRKRAGQEYVGIGDTYFNLSEDFGPLGYDVILIGEHACEPYAEERAERDERGKPVKDAAGKIVMREGWTCYAKSTVELVLRIPNDPGKDFIRKQGVGAHSSEMQPNPAMAYENAVKGAFSDAVKRAAAPLGPRYGLALLFSEKKGDDRVAMGMLEEPEAVKRAKAARDAKRQPGITPNPPGSSPPAASAAGASTGPLPKDGDGGAIPPAASSVQGPSPTTPSPAAPAEEEGVSSATPASEQPKLPGVGTVYGEKATTSKDALVRLMNGDFDPGWKESLRLGSEAPFVQPIPLDPPLSVLERSGWNVPMATPAELVKISAADPAPKPMVDAVTSAGVKLAGREGFGRMWLALGGGGAKDPPPNGYQLRLMVLATMGIAKRRAVAT